MKRLYTESEYIRFYSIPPVIFAIWFFVLWFFSYEKNKLFGQFLGAAIIILILVELVILCMWYPKELQKKTAIKNGKEYIGKIRSVRMMSQKRYNAYRRHFAYVIRIEVNINGKAQILEEGPFSDNPENFIREGDDCKVYLYKNKLYPQFFFVRKADLKKGHIANNKKVYLIVPPIFLNFCNSPEMKKTMLVKVTMYASKMYNSEDFFLHKRISEHLEKINLEYVANIEEVIQENIKQLVLNAIYEKEPTVKIDEFRVVIK